MPGSSPATKSSGRGGKKPAVPWDALPSDVLELVASCLPERDRYKLNIVCQAWRQGLADAREVWAAVTVDPRKKASTSRRIRFKKSLPTPEALAGWFGRYGRHVQRLHLRHLDADAQREGCVAAADVASLLQAVAGSLRQLCFHHCTVQALLANHAAGLRCLQQLTSLHFQLPSSEALSLGTPPTDFLTALTGLQDLALATGYQSGGHYLPASLAALPSLRSLQLARVGAPGGVLHPDNGSGLLLMYLLRVASGLAALSSLERLAVSDFLMVEEEGPGPAGMRLPPALCCLPRLTSLVLSDVGIGMMDPPGNLPLEGNAGLYALPAGLSSLAGSLAELALLRHTCTAEELGVLAALTGLTSLALTAKLRGASIPVPDVLSQLSGLGSLKISQGLTQVPPAITGLTRLTLLDLSHNSLHSLKPGPYLKRLVAVSLGANAFSRFPQQLKVARHTAQEIQLFSNDSMTISEKDLEQLLGFEQLRQLTIYGASEDKTTRRCLAQLQKSMPWLLVDV